MRDSKRPKLRKGGYLPGIMEHSFKGLYSNKGIGTLGWVHGTEAYPKTGGVEQKIPGQGIGEGRPQIPWNNVVPWGARRGNSVLKNAESEENQPGRERSGDVQPPNGVGYGTKNRLKERKGQYQRTGNGQQVGGARAL